NAAPELTVQRACHPHRCGLATRFDIPGNFPLTPPRRIFCLICLIHCLIHCLVRCQIPGFIHVCVGSRIVCDRRCRCASSKWGNQGQQGKYEESSHNRTFLVCSLPVRQIHERNVCVEKNFRFRTFPVGWVPHHRHNVQLLPHLRPILLVRNR